MQVDTHHYIEHAGRRCVEQIKRKYAVAQCFLYDLSDLSGDDDTGESAVLFVLFNARHADVLDTTLAISKIGASILKETGVRILINPIWPDEWKDRSDLKAHSLPFGLEMEPLRL